MGVASFASHVLFCYTCLPGRRAKQVDIVLEELDDGGVFEEPGFMFVAALAVLLLVEGVFRFDVSFASLGVGEAGHDGEEVGPGVGGLVGLRLRLFGGG